jgi:hypothetical protein
VIVKKDKMSMLDGWGRGVFKTPSRILIMGVRWSLGC